MVRVRKYGKEPFNVTVIHGGPGAPGQVAPLARVLSGRYGVLEPMQSADSIDGQIRELKEIIEENTESPVILIGHSWGAWLSYMFAAVHPGKVNKLILVSSGPYEEQYVTAMNQSRNSRLSIEEKRHLSELMGIIVDPARTERNSALSEFGKLMSKVDSFAPIYQEDEVIDFQPQVHNNCMKELRSLRRSGELLTIGASIECPVVAIHGDHDPHPHEGVEIPLSRVIKDFRFNLLKNCGHYPWNEHFARELFFETLYREL